MHNDYKYIFTVFTPTFNRADKIHRVYDSLIKQTFDDFEWLIIDDGSTDNLKDIIQPWIKEANFPIRYVFQKNSSKHVAFNLGVSLAEGALFLPADDDDTFFPNALEILYQTWIDIDDKELYSAVTGLCINNHTREVVGDKYPEDIFDSNTLESQYIYNIQGEKWGFQRTDVLKEFPFPTLDDEKFIPENYIWTQIARKYKTRYINKILRVYYQYEGGNLLETKIKYPNALLQWYLFDINQNSDYLIKNYKLFLKSFINATRMHYHTNQSLADIVPYINHPVKKLFFILSYPLGIFFALRDR